MITEKAKRRAEIVKDEVAKSKVDSLVKEVLIENIDDTLEATNGLSEAEKIQKNSESNHVLSLLIAKMYCTLSKDKPTTTWKDVLIRALNSWKVVVMVALVTALLALRPEIAAIIQAVAK